MRKLLIVIMMVALLFSCNACADSRAGNVQYVAEPCELNKGLDTAWSYYKLDEDGYPVYDTPVFEKKWEYTCDFEFGVGIVKENGLWGLINVNGEYISEPQWNRISSFDSTSLLAKVEKDDMAGYINTKGELVLPLVWQADKCDPFSEGLARIEDPNGYANGYMNTQGQLVIDYQWWDCHEFHEGLAMVEDSSSGIGYINKKGELQVPLHSDWENCSEFWHGVAFVCRKLDSYPWEEWGVINTNGEWIVEPYYSDYSICNKDRHNNRSHDYAWLSKDDEAYEVHEVLHFDYNNGLYYYQNFSERDEPFSEQYFSDHILLTNKTSIPLALSHNRPSR